MKKLFPIALMLFITAAAFCQKKTSAKTSTESTSVSISNNNSEYSLNASFNEERSASVRQLIIKALGQAGETAGEQTKWNLKETYSVFLKTRKLTINLDKEKATRSLYKLIKQLGQDIQNALTKPSSTEIKG